MTVVYYQRRAADEPPDKVTFCSACPIDARKLTSDTINTESVKKSDRSQRAPARLPRDNAPVQLRKVATRVLLVSTGAASRRCMRLAAETRRSALLCKRVCALLNNKVEVVQYVVGSVLYGGVSVVERKQMLSPFVEMRTVSVYACDSSIILGTQTTVDGYEVALNGIPHTDAATLRMLPGERAPTIIMVVSREPIEGNGHCDGAILGSLNELLLRYGTEESIHTFTDVNTVSSLYIRSARSYDWNMAPKEGFKYSWKPDGVGYWCVRYGCVWLFCLPRLGARIVGWVVCDRVRNGGGAGAILHVEVMVGHTSILLDVLASHDGAPTPMTRGMEDVFRYFDEVSLDGLCIGTKEYFESAEDLVANGKPPYPVDGIVGTRSTSTDIIRIKDARSIELVIGDDGELYSSDGIHVASSPVGDRYEAGTVIEVRFTLSAVDGSVTVTDVFPRGDKEKANSYDACLDIFNAASCMPDALARRHTLSWCNSVRKVLHSLASRGTGVGRVVLDIGAGDGQAVSDYAMGSNATYLLVEPDEARCVKLVRRLDEATRGGCRYYPTTDGLLKAVSMLSKGTVRFIVVRATLSEVLRDGQVLDSLRTCVRCCVATFSISYVAEELKKLSLAGISVVGCGYLYDSANRDGYIVNSAGVVMRKISDGIAEVKWGGDTKYHEPVVTTGDFDDVMYVRPATDLVPAQSDDQYTLMQEVCRSMRVVTTLRNI